MPIYEYRCDACGHTFDVFQKFSDAPVETCEVCGGRVTKVLHPAAIHFKGSGFYTTDYGRGSSKQRPGAGEGPGKAGDEAAASKTDGDARATKAGESADGKSGGTAAGGGPGAGAAGAKPAARPAATSK